MLAVHNMHLTQLVLKTMAIGLGGTEAYSRFYGDANDAMQ